MVYVNNCSAGDDATCINIFAEEATTTVCCLKINLRKFDPISTDDENIDAFYE